MPGVATVLNLHDTFHPSVPQHDEAWFKDRQTIGQNETPRHPIAIGRQGGRARFGPQRERAENGENKPVRVGTTSGSSGGPPGFRRQTQLRTTRAGAADVLTDASRGLGLG